ncbi:hypothetical protein LCGC14_1192110 [marine sediment metagenome]|uniref:Uncharacterized protein n=1 Tax=marine sediment metagenome TaxID=412755 RepID=A0A0F9M6V0_9ZZZZ
MQVSECSVCQTNLINVIAFVYQGLRHCIVCLRETQPGIYATLCSYTAQVKPIAETPLNTAFCERCGHAQFFHTLNTLGCYGLSCSCPAFQSA